MKAIKFSLIFFLFGILFSMPFSGKAAYFKNQPYTITQPNGIAINCFVSGDEYFNWIHDGEGYTFIQNSDGYFYYAVNSGELVIPSNFQVNSVDPASVNIPKGVRISENEYKKRVKLHNLHMNNSVKAPHSGVLNNIVVFIKFSDQTEFTSARSVFNNKLNATPGSSLKEYYDEVSYNNLDIESNLYPTCALTTNLSYTDSHPRAYYSPYNATTNPLGYQSSESTDREHTLLVNAVNAIASQVPAGLNIDGDNDGNVDNVCFVIRGQNDAWAELLWAHRWSLYSQTVNINGKRVMDYTFQPETQNDVQTLCHEMFHALGAPDLYHYSYDGYTTAGDWDLMESGFGHMGAFMKWKYASQSWVTSLPEITTSGTYTLHPLTSATNNCYKIASPNSFSEYFVVEYRKKISGTFEFNIPNSGLLVYRINTTVGDGNADGPPDEVYIYRNGGTTTTNGAMNGAAFASDYNKTQINDNSNPGSFLTDGSPGGLNIYDITSADTTISFTIGFNAVPITNFTANLFTVSAGGAVNFSDLSTGNPTSWKWTFDGGNPSTSTIRNPQGIIYNTPGVYNVKLKSINANGSDSIVKTGFIQVSSNILNCANATPLYLGVTISDSTINSINNVNKYSCTNNKFIGPEKVYSLTLTQSCDLTVSLTNQSSGSLYVMIMGGCDAQNCFTMNAGSAFLPYTPAGTYYISVDGYNGASGRYNITANCSGNIGVVENSL
ncbi:MAG: M6 family metalloprotease domain-containing protein, partial [Bacteroidetes bacterium]|nr:M6 family metalloprotease domain-containing protein [Bacteroidota bacterium]